MVINAGGLNISLNLIYKDEFQNLTKYITNCEPEFYLESSKDFPQFSEKKLINQTQYFDLFETDKGILQLQKQQKTYIGAILYRGKKAEIYPMVGGFVTEYLLSQYAFVKWVEEYGQGLFIHSSAIAYGAAGVLFCAKSGTGKSTQRRLWCKHGAICINDDKNVLALKGDSLVLLPNPWSGKHFEDNNLSRPLKAVIFLYQNKENVITVLSKEKALNLLLGQISLPTKDKQEVWNKIVDKILALKLINYGCNMEDEAFIKLSSYLKENGII